MSKDNLYTGKEVRVKLMSGIRKVADAVKVTMGTGGSNSLIEVMESPNHMATNDGYTIANSIHLEDPIENMGRNILLESISRANKESGDGSSTTCLLTSKILEEGFKLDGVNAMEVKRSLEDCISFIEENLQSQKKDIEIEDIGTVASISAEDEEIGKRIQEIYEQIGKDGLIYWDISKTAEDSYSLGKGISVEGAGYLSPYMCDMDEKTGAIFNYAKLKNPLILMTKEKITTAAVLEKLYIALNEKNKKEIVIFCDEIEATVIGQLVQTRVVRGFRTLVIKMPTLWKDWWYEDLARASGATIIDPAAGLYLKDVKMEHLGTFGHITVTKDDTYIDGIKDMSDYVKELQDKGDDDSRLRASRLNMKTARYFVGAHSESALSYRRLKVEDAISAAYHALHGGVVAGGGVALRNVADAMPDTIGGNILAAALIAPEEQIAVNSGHKAYMGTDPEKGLNSKTGEVVVMFDAGILDPLTIVLNACKNAISVAASILTCKTVIILPRAEELSQRNSGLIMR